MLISVNWHEITSNNVRLIEITFLDVNSHDRNNCIISEKALRIAFHYNFISPCRFLQFVDNIEFMMIR